MKQLILLSAALLSVLIAHAQTGNDFIDINNYDALISPSGNHFWDYNNRQMTVDDSAAGTVFTSTLWIGGTDVGGSLHLAAERYRQSGTDFTPGPVSGVYDGQSNAAWNRVWKVNRQEVLDWHYAYQAAVQAQLNGQTPIWPTPPPIIADWPGNGETTAPVNQAHDLAPFVDLDGDGEYEPNEGDYPAIPGDQAVFFMYNDDAMLHTETGGDKMGVEVHGMAYGFDCEEDVALDNTLFFHYTIYNRSNTDYQDVYIGLWSDFELGCGQDDYVGSDPARNMFYVYNGDDNDENCAGFSGYGTNLAAQGIKILKGVKMDNDNTDNSVSEAPYAYNFGDNIVDNEHFGLSRFMYHNNSTGPGATQDPQAATDYYNLLRGLWKDGTPLSYGGIGYDPGNPNTIPALYMFPDSADSLNYGTNGIATTPWSEVSAGNSKGDRRGLGTMGPFSLPANGMVEFDIAYVFARGASAADAIAEMKMDADHIQELFESGATNCGTPFGPGVYPLSASELIDRNTISVFPNPASDRLTIESANIVRGAQLQLLDVRGRVVQSAAFSGTAHTMDVQDLQPGVYFLKIKSPESENTIKVMLK